MRAGDEALGEADAVVQLAQRDQAGVGGDLTPLEIEAGFSVVAEGEIPLRGALCIQGRSLPKQRFGLLPRYLDAFA